jgi:hypothetical protein
MRDFMLIARPSGDLGRYIGSSFETVVDHLKEVAERACPQIRWQADFSLGNSQFVEIFSAPDYDTALRVSGIVREVEGVRAEVTPLKSSWQAS